MADPAWIATARRYLGGAGITLQPCPGDRDDAATPALLQRGRGRILPLSDALRAIDPDARPGGDAVLRGAGGRCAMTTYIMLVNWTEQGIRDVKSSPKRLD